MVVLPDSVGAESFYTKDGAVVLVGGPNETIDGKTYFSRWFNTTTGQWEDIPEVKAAYEASVPDYYHGLAPTEEQFSPEQPSAIPLIIADLRRGPSLLDADAQPPPLGLWANGAERGFTLAVNYQGKINGAPAASIVVEEGGYKYYIIIYEILNADHTRGYLAASFWSSSGVHSSYDWFIQRHPGGKFELSILTDSSEPIPWGEPKLGYIVDQPGFHDAVSTYEKTHIIPAELENGIIISGDPLH